MPNSNQVCVCVFQHPVCHGYQKRALSEQVETWPLCLTLPWA